MKKFMIVFTAVCLSTAAFAGDGKAKVKEPKAPKEKAVLEEVAISGVLSKYEVKKGDKIGVKYVLTDGEGNKITVPPPQKPKKGGEVADVIDLEQHVNSAVTIKGMGMKTAKGVLIKTLTSVEKGAVASTVEAPAEQGAVPDVGGQDM